MSRSYKKSPVCTDHTSPRTKWAKRQAAKAVRRHDGFIENGRSYRKLFCSWNICDYRFYQTKEKAVFEWEKDVRLQSGFSKERMLRNWEKFYRRK
ncbi:hypothetical protein A8709_00685 [Paenibacillus pectinilyticus]|uniref:Uncharacterized protein n=1 Tax=Paenibacillus pectinilyticus TaxID=512399 RepID=A0A1C1A8E9_9BACL|nr:hypothetical protein [Paenibacillus pectinilyticus]OCT16865.1 hypothetical protein A8709_00685 [Paenibacillus pectinilyticus]